MKVSRTGILISALPGLVGLVLLCALTIHVRLIIGWRLSDIPIGPWPASLGEHFVCSSHYFWLLLAWSIFVAPVAIVVCRVVPRWQHLVVYLGINLLFCVAALCATLLTPWPFRRWLFD